MLDMALGVSGIGLLAPGDRAIEIGEPLSESIIFFLNQTFRERVKLKSTGNTSIQETSHTLASININDPIWKVLCKPSSSQSTPHPKEGDDRWYL
jgi:hypothetical protein